jgi:molybdopterin molybdotransferase
MITVEEARAIIMRHVPLQGKQRLPLDAAVGHVLAADVVSPVPYPLFDMSAMDGYAVGGPTGPWRRVGALAAGAHFGGALKADECVRIFTGAQVPTEAYAVLQQEHCTERDGVMHWTGGPFAQGANIRRKAESVQQGDLLLAKGMVLHAAGVGLLASCGLAEVTVHTPPRVSVVRSGGEFIEPSEPSEGRIHSSNEHMLLAATRQAGCVVAGAPLLADDVVDDVRNALLSATRQGDVVITTGGVSVGDHDLLLPALKDLGATIHFHGVAQKPGKPMLFATLNGVPVFALPGNPRAVMVLFWEYVLPFLRAMQGAADPWPRTELLPIAAAITVKGVRTEFRAARVREGHVHLLADEGSHMLRTLVLADAIAYLPPDVRTLLPGDAVEIHYLPQ